MSARTLQIRDHLAPILATVRRVGFRVNRFHNLYVVTDPDTRLLAVAIDMNPEGGSEMVLSMAAQR
jgi:hypothetical protein